jgi:hypothetical protein
MSERQLIKVYIDGGPIRCLSAAERECAWSSRFLKLSQPPPGSLQLSLQPTWSISS